MKIGSRSGRLWRRLFVQLLIICVPLLGHGQGTRLSAIESGSLFEVSAEEVKALSAIFSSEPALFQALDELYISGSKSTFEMLLDDRSVIPSLLYAAENKVSVDFENEVLKQFEFNTQEQARLLQKLNGRLSQDPTLRRRLKAGIEKMMARVEQVKPRFKWRGERMINAALIAASIASFAYSFEVSFIDPGARPAFADMIGTIKNLMYLYMFLPVTADVLDFGRELRNYLRERREAQKIKSELADLRRFLEAWTEIADLNPVVDLAQKFGDPQLREQVEKWARFRREKLRLGIEKFRRQPGLVRRLRERGLVKDLSKFDAFLKNLNFDVEDQNYYWVMKTFNELKRKYPELQEQELVEKEHEVLTAPIREMARNQEGIRRRVARTNQFLTVGLTLIGVHAALGAEPSALDEVFGPRLIEMIRAHTHFLYMTAAATAIIPLGEFWWGMARVTRGLKARLEVTRAFELVDSLFRRTFQNQLTAGQCLTLFH